MEMLIAVVVFSVALVCLAVAIVTFRQAIDQQTRVIAAMHETLKRDCGAELDD